MADRFFIETFIGVEGVGIYTVANQVSNAFMLILSSVILAWTPWLLKRLKDQKTYKRKCQIVKATYVLIISSVFLSVAFGLILPIITDILIGEAFLKAREVVTPLALSGGFFGAYQVLSVYLIYEEKTKVIAKFVITALCFNLLANYILIPLEGIEGAAYARILSYLLMLVLTGTWVARNIELPWKLEKDKASLG